MIDYHCTGDTTYFDLHKVINYSKHELYLLRTYEGLWWENAPDWVITANKELVEDTTFFIPKKRKWGQVVSTQD